MLKVKVKGHVIHTLSWILGMSYSVIVGLVLFLVYINKLLSLTQLVLLSLLGA